MPCSRSRTGNGLACAIPRTSPRWWRWCGRRPTVPAACRGACRPTTAVRSRTGWGRRGPSMTPTPGTWGATACRGARSTCARRRRTATWSRRIATAWCRSMRRWGSGAAVTSTARPITASSWPGFCAGATRPGRWPGRRSRRGCGLCRQAGCRTGRNGTGGSSPAVWSPWTDTCTPCRRRTSANGSVAGWGGNRSSSSTAANRSGSRIGPGARRRASSGGTWWWTCGASPARSPRTGTATPSSPPPRCGNCTANSRRRSEPGRPAGSGSGCWRRPAGCPTRDSRRSWQSFSRCPEPWRHRPPVRPRSPPELGAARPDKSYFVGGALASGFGLRMLSLVKASTWLCWVSRSTAAMLAMASLKIRSHCEKTRLLETSRLRRSWE